MRRLITLAIFLIFIGCGDIPNPSVVHGGSVRETKTASVVYRVYGANTKKLQPMPEMQISQSTSKGTLGTRPMPTSRGETGQRRVVESVYQMTATAYSYTGRATTSGKMPRKGLVAADWTQFPKGTKLYIQGYGFAEVADTGSLIKAPWNRKDNRRYAELDVYFPDEKDAVKWGRPQVNVWVYK